MGNENLYIDYKRQEIVSKVPTAYLIFIYKANKWVHDVIWIEEFQMFNSVIFY